MLVLLQPPHGLESLREAQRLRLHSSNHNHFNQPKENLGIIVGKIDKNASPRSGTSVPVLRQAPEKSVTKIEGSYDVWQVKTIPRRNPDTEPEEVACARCTSDKAKRLCDTEISPQPKWEENSGCPHSSYRSRSQQSHVSRISGLGWSTEPSSIDHDDFAAQEIFVSTLSSDIERVALAKGEARHRNGHSDRTLERRTASEGRVL